MRNETDDRYFRRRRQHNHVFWKGGAYLFTSVRTYHLDKSNNTYKHFRTCRAIILKI